jgi:hypothetical protein
VAAATGKGAVQIAGMQTLQTMIFSYLRIELEVKMGVDLAAKS